MNKKTHDKLHSLYELAGYLDDLEKLVKHVSYCGIMDCRERGVNLINKIRTEMHKMYKE